MTTTIETPKEAAPGVQQMDVQANNPNEKSSLYKKHERIFPKRASGKFRKIKWIVLAATLGIYFILPWLTWYRGEGITDQAVLFDFADKKRMYMFGIEFWAQELYYVTGILIISALALFMVSAVAGRIWCGYACPQTIWTDLMIAIEHFWQGDRNARIRLSKSKWTFEKFWKLAATHLTWILLGVVTGVTAVLYFAPAYDLAGKLITGTAPFIAYVFIFIFALFTYVLGGLAREQVCIYMCPWPRIQGAMFDADSLLITYRGFRGEPRGSHKKGESWEGRGDCIDCKQCIAVCPMGIDIRNGPQLECIQCSLCIDACDQIMDTIKRPRGLIAYDSYRNLEAESHGERVKIPIIRARTILYAGMLTIVCAVMAIVFSYRTVLEVNVVAERNPLFVPLADGSLRNTYTVRILNKTYQKRTFTIRIEGLEGAKLTVSKQEGVAEPKSVVEADQEGPEVVFVDLPKDKRNLLHKGEGSITFVVRDTENGNEAHRTTNFRGPDH